MNSRAAELGMKSTSFENVTGLDDTVTNHLTSAYDIALMSRELIKHAEVMKYASVWQDSIRDGEFTLTNTNRLVRYYKGCTGLKTGSTDKAGFCVSATAERDGMHLIAVIMGAPTSNARNNAARALLDYGFAGFALLSDENAALEDVPVRFGHERSLTLCTTAVFKIVEKGALGRIEKRYEIPEYLNAPVSEGERVGSVIYTLDGEEIARADIVASQKVERLGFLDIFFEILASFIKT
jgi:D-alanyl-D-alanine carboxypeptidase (penicillin-binding protein 5/6)